MEAQPKCNLIIDSCCDLPFEVIDRTGVQLLEFPYIDEKGEHSDDLYRSVTPHEFYEGMRAGSQPSTAQVPVTVFHDVFSKAIESGVPTVYLSFTSGLSGSFNTAVMMRDQLIAEHPEAELYVVDTYLASVAEALLVYEALNQRDNGMTARELAAWAEEARYRVRTLFMVDNLDALHRGGRLPKGVAVVGDALDVKALLHFNLDGTLGIRSVARGRKKGMRKLVDYYAKNVNLDDEANVCGVGDADVADDGFAVAAELRALDDGLEVLRPTIGPTIGSHVGPGMLSVVFWGRDRRNDKAVTKVKGVRQAK